MFYQASLCTLLMLSQMDYQINLKLTTERVALLALSSACFFNGHFFWCLHNSFLIQRTNQCSHARWSLCWTIMSTLGLLHHTNSPPIQSIVMYLWKSPFLPTSSSFWAFSTASHLVRKWISFHVHVFFVNATQCFEVPSHNEHINEVSHMSLQQPNFSLLKEW